MAQERLSSSGSRREEEEALPDPDLPTAAAPAAQTTTTGTDDLLDAIDSVLESNAEAFVKGFVQKGGQ